VGSYVYYITRPPKAMSKLMSVSAKFSLPMIAGLFVGSVVTELTMFDIKGYPEDYGLEPAPNVPRHH
jgi:hypothetical protein